ncbi:ATP synthase subunit beta [Methylopila jiangsuensis]|uniref:ATP synthase subunit beta n=1 Tax=Methylopila jiangsuensis TaxID=586230 RepID=A0A9W6JG89_9HYPH|nr:SAM-dependent methyltransferase [Methylopila jiangsuensis]MDR6285705.1 NADH dehydrogenase [ubiquinone] 1 alpha subcomplex assembly factor 7 [Methylopila jiangsuensis]GLK75464.1 ATP synthase subunit beta [Methylopila jiangsuensis]
MTPLAREIAEIIADEGPIGVDRYMALCLGHPLHGYYATRDPFGAGGDFVTAPEISQMFGELLGLWCAEVWSRMGAPAKIALVELGPGRGTLMADALRAARALPGFRDAIEVTLVETSATLREIQSARLDGAGVPLRWAATVDEALGDAPVIVLANEFFDALPIRQFVATPAGWRERLVGLDGGRLAFGLASGPPRDLSLPGRAPGAVIETCAPGAAIAARIGAHLSVQGGAMLAIDYGEAASAGDTLQAVKAHLFADPLAEPGDADLTAQVDFGALARAGASAGARAAPLVRQAELMERLGLGLRAERLKRSASPEQARAIDAAAARLIDRAPTGMGALFKALALAHPRLALPAFDS